MDATYECEGMSAGGQRRFSSSRARDASEIQARCSEQVSGQDYYSKLSESGNQYGCFFQSISQLWRYNGDMLGEVPIPEGIETEFDTYRFHPALLDACCRLSGLV